MTTKAQEWARKRNFLKRQITAARFNCVDKTKVTTKIERQLLDSAILKIDKVLWGWDENNVVSKERYLKCGEK